MTDNAIVAGEFTHFRHLKTRKVVVLEVEIPEELFQDAISKLGMPIGGESKPVAIALLDKSVVKESFTGEPTEGEKLRTRAVMLCKERGFQIFCESLDKNIIVFNENHAREFLINYCNIKSRSELATNIEAQNKFKELLESYKAWQFEQQYGDNLNRY